MMFFNNEKVKQEAYQAGRNSVHFLNSCITDNPYGYFKQRELYNIWNLGFMDGLNKLQINTRENFFNYQTPKACCIQDLIPQDKNGKFNRI